VIETSGIDVEKNDTGGLDGVERGGYEGGGEEANGASTKDGHGRFCRIGERMVVSFEQTSSPGSVKEDGERFSHCGKLEG